MVQSLVKAFPLVNTWKPLIPLLTVYPECIDIHQKETFGCRCTVIEYDIRVEPECLAWLCASTLLRGNLLLTWDI